MYDKDRFDFRRPVFIFCQEDDLSQKSIEWITGKIVLDAGFREALLADPDQALANFDLTESEKASIKCLDSETMDLLANTLADRITHMNSGSRSAFIKTGKEPED
jgi:hypothetical protein